MCVPVNCPMLFTFDRTHSTWIRASTKHTHRLKHKHGTTDRDTYTQTEWTMVKQPGVVISMCSEREREKRHWILFIIHVIDTFGPFKSFKPMYRYLSLQMFVCVRVREREKETERMWKGKMNKNPKSKWTWVKWDMTVMKAFVNETKIQRDYHPLEYCFRYVWYDTDAAHLHILFTTFLLTLRPVKALSLFWKHKIAQR